MSDQRSESVWSVIRVFEHQKTLSDGEENLLGVESRWHERVNLFSPLGRSDRRRSLSDEFIHLSVWDYRSLAVKMTSCMLIGQAFGHISGWKMMGCFLRRANVKLVTLYSKIQFVSSVTSWLECEFVWEPNQSNGSVRQSASQSERHTCCWLNSAPLESLSIPNVILFWKIKRDFQPCERLWGVRV